MHLGHCHFLFQLHNTTSKNSMQVVLCFNYLLLRHNRSVHVQFWTRIRHRFLAWIRQGGICVNGVALPRTSGFVCVRVLRFLLNGRLMKSRWIFFFLTGHDLLFFLFDCEWKAMQKFERDRFLLCIGLFGTCYTKQGIVLQSLLKISATFR